MTKSAIVAAGAAIFLAVVLACAGPSWAIVLDQLVIAGGLMLVWLAAAIGIGWPILWLIVKNDEPRSVLWLCTSAALGMGVMSLAVLALGLAGWLNQTTAWSMIAAGLCIAARQLYLHRVRLEAWMHARAGWGWACLVAALPTGIVAVAALMPPGILWGDEPNGYDVVEYHLQIPRQWYEAGRITPLHENVFSYFPQGVEMHYLLAMELRGGPWEGMYLAQFMHAAMFAVAAVAVGTASTEAGLIVAVTPWVTLLAPVAYVEGGALMFGTLAILWAMRPGVRAVAIAGAMAGFACGVKLTNVPMLLCAIPVACAIGDRSQWLKRTAMFLAAGLIVFAPWLIRTAAWAGNPLFPEAMNLLGHAHFSAVQVERWRRAYLPTTGRWTGFWQQVLSDWRFGFVLLPAGLIAGVMSLRSHRSRYLLAMLLITTVVWIGFTHLQSRFFVPAIPIAALLLAEIKLPRIAAAALIGILLICNLVPIAQRLTHFLSLDRQVADEGGVGLLGRENIFGMRDPDMRDFPPQTRLDLVGDVSPFFYQLPMSRLRYRTVFDVDASDASRSVVEDWLNGSDAPEQNRLIVIDPGELQRLSRTYYGIPPLPDQELQALSERKDVYVSTPGR
jgi:hypothetical protein